MNIRMMAQNQLMNQGFMGIGRTSFSPPPAWVNPRTDANHPANRNQTTPATDPTVREAGHHIQNALNALTPGRNSASAAIEGRTSDAEVATVRVDNARTIASMPPRNATLDITQVATAQQNVGEAFSAAADRAVDSGSFSFAIEAGGQAHSFNINVTDADTNATIQRRMAETINAANIGVRAEVATEGTGANATTALTLTAAQTGENAAFSVTDITGDLAASMGVTTATTDAQNAIFTVDGGFQRVSQSNEVSLGAGATATLQGEGRTEITFGRDTEQLMNAATDLVNAINASLRNINASDGRGSAQFLQDLRGMNQTFANTLSRVGINVANDGRLSINEERLQQSAEDGSLSRLFENQNMGFAGRANTISSNAARSNLYRNTPAPVQFTSPTNNFDFGNANDSWSMMNMFW